MKKLIIISLLMALSIIKINSYTEVDVCATAIEKETEKNESNDNENIVDMNIQIETKEKPIACNEMLDEEIKKLKIFNKYNKALKIGSKGQNVKSLHILLKWLNYDVDYKSITFTKKTQIAVTKFQKDHSIKENGIVDKLTYIRLNDYIHSSKIKYKHIDYNIKIGPTNDYWIIINKTTNVLQLYKGKNRLKIYPIATGRFPSFTPEGKYEISNKLINASWKKMDGGIASNPLGSRWMGLSVKNHYTYGIHGCGRPESIGTYASAGCIRMYNFQSEELYNIVKVHTPVWIGTTDKLEKWIQELNKEYEKTQENQIQEKKQEDLLRIENEQKHREQCEKLNQEIEKLQQEKIEVANQYKEVIKELLNSYIEKSLIEYYGEVIASTTRTVDSINIYKASEEKKIVTIELTIWMKQEIDIPITKERISFSIEQGEVNIKHHEHLGFEFSSEKEKHIKITKK